MKIFKLIGHLDEHGVSVVLGAILLLGIGIAVGSLVYSQYVQSTLHSAEAGFMNDVGGKFVQLQSSISTMRPGDSSVFNFKMNPSFPFFIPTQGEVGTLSANSGAASSALQQLSATIWNNIGGSVGSSSALDADDGKYWEANQVVFSERFPYSDYADWTENTIVDDTGTITPAFDSGVSYPPDGTGSIHVNANAAKDNKTSIENAYWERDFGSALPSYPNLTLQAWFKKNYNWVNDPGSDDAIWQIDIENGLTTTGSHTLYTHQENTSVSGTGYLSLKIDNADAAGTNLSASAGSVGRQLWGKTVYSLQSVQSILTSTWTFNYRSWLSTVPPITMTNSPTSASVGWTNPSNAFADGGGYASTISDNIDNNPASQTYQGYGFNIPAGSTINQVRVRYDAYTAGLAQSITLLPNAAGDLTNLSLSGAPTNWQATNTDDTDTSYVYGTGGSFAGDLYNLNDTSQTGTIDNVVVYIKVRGTISSSGPGGVAETSIKTGGVTFNGAGVNVTTSYQTFSTTYTVNPQTSSAWTWAQINSLQAGVQLQKPGGGESTRATYVWVVVNYHQPTNDNIRVYFSGDGGNSWSSPQVTSLTFSETTENTYWDNVSVIGWLPDNLKDNNFRVKVDAVAAGAAGQVRLDWIPVEVTYTLPPAIAQASVDILVRENNGTIRHVIADNVAISDNLTLAQTTLSKNYSWTAYTVEDNSDYLEIDYYVDVTTAATGENAYLRIDDSSLPTSDQTRVTNVIIVSGGLVWTPSVIYHEDSGTSGFDWMGFSSAPIAGKIETIRAWMYAYAKSFTASGSTANLDVWTDYISLLAGPPFWDNVLIGSRQILSPQYVDNVVVTIGFTSKDSGSRDNLYILENNGTDNWRINSNPVLLSENVLNAGSKFYWENIVLDVENNPGKYIDNNGVIWLNVLAENDNSPFRLQFDYVNFQVNYLPEHEQNTFIQGYYGSSGALTFQMNLYSFPNQSYIYDDGAVILVQNNTSVMVSQPSLVSVSNIKEDPNNIEVDFNHVSLIGFAPPPITKTGYASIGVKLENEYPVYGPINNQPENYSVILQIKKYSLTENAWQTYLQSRADYLNTPSDNNFFYAKGFVANFEPYADENYFLFYITENALRSWDGLPHILYYERVREVSFSIS
jgi:hypothetical protein